MVAGNGAVLTHTVRNPRVERQGLYCQVVMDCDDCKSLVTVGLGQKPRDYPDKDAVRTAFKLHVTWEQGREQRNTQATTARFKAVSA